MAGNTDSPSVSWNPGDKVGKTASLEDAKIPTSKGEEIKPLREEEEKPEVKKQPKAKEEEVKTVNGVVDTTEVDSKGDNR